ncbi:MAG TPA: hypothetical protein VER32_03485 [Pyrinomonadaceae bacterium]|nr:hypothetical protein [Pyrinomonadaceae bacterium]
MTNKQKYAPWLVAAAALVVYLCFPTRNYYWDGIAFALDIERVGRLSAELLHQNHLLYNVVGYLLYALARRAGFDVRAIEVLQILNGVLSAACAFVLFHILRRSLRSTYLSACLSLLFAFSATWWKFSTDADSYVPATLLMLAAFHLLLPGREPRPLAVALLHAGAMLLHQLAVFFWPAAVAGLLLQASGRDARRRLRPAIIYTAAASLLTLAVYYLCFRLRTESLDPRAFVGWMASYSSGSGGFVFDFVSNLKYTLRGHVRLLWGGRFNLLRDYVNAPTVALLALLIISAAALLVQAARHFRDTRLLSTPSIKNDATLRAVATLALVWMTPYLIFCFFFYPQDTFHRLVYLPAPVILVGVALASVEPGRARRYRLALFTAVLALSNFLFVVYPYSHVRPNTPLAMAYEMRARWSPRTVVFYDFFNSDDAILRYFNPPVRWQKPGAWEAGALDEELRKVYQSGGEAWVESSAVGRLTREPGGAEWLAARARETRELTDPAYTLKLVRVAPPE